MTGRWFFSHQGEVYGPVELEEIQQLAQKGQLESESMILKEGRSHRVSLKEGSREVEAPSVDSKVPVQRSVQDPTEGVQRWVILKGTVEDGKSKFTQDGPYETPEVLAKIQSGEINYSDHCWTDGYSEWRLIREEPLLNDQDIDSTPDLVSENTVLTEPDFEMPDPASLLDEMEGSIQFSSTESVEAPLAEAPPEGVVGVDLAAPEELSYVFTPDEETEETAPAEPATASEFEAISPPPPAGGVSESSLVMELEGLEESVVKEPLREEEPEVQPEPPRTYTGTGRLLDQPQVRQRLLEAQMESHSGPQASSSMAKYMVILVGALLLLLFGLKLAQDLGQ